MREAVIVSTARTPIGKAYRGAFNNTQGQELIGHALAQAVKRAGIDAAEVEDVVVGCAMQQGSTGGNVARQGLLRAGLPGDRVRHDDRPAVLVRPDGDRDGRQADRPRRHAGHDRRRRRVDLAGAERQDESLPRGRSVAGEEPAADLHDDDRDRRDRRRALRREPRSAGSSTRCNRSSAPRPRRPKVATTRRSRR